MSESTRFCDGCGIEHPRTEKFWYFQSGRATACKVQKKLYRQRNRKKILDYQRKYRQDPEKKKKMTVQTTKWRRHNQERNRTYMREYARARRQRRQATTVAAIEQLPASRPIGHGLRDLLDTGQMLTGESGPLLWVRSKLAAIEIPMDPKVDPRQVRLLGAMGGNRTIQFYAAEVQDKPRVVLAMVRSARGDCEAILGSDCEARQTAQWEADSFLGENHIFGSIVSMKHMALVHDGQIVALMSARRQRDRWMEIGRFAVKNGYTVAGAFSKLMMYGAEVLSADGVRIYCDQRFSDGTEYELNGFVRVEERQGYVWTNGLHIYRGRINAARATDMGWFRIKDAGQIRYEMLIIR